VVKLRVPRALLTPLLLLLPAEPLSKILLTPPARVAAQLIKGTLAMTAAVHGHQLEGGRAGGVGGEDEGSGSGTVAADVTRGCWKP
jgi:hypothetical protein